MSLKAGTVADLFNNNQVSKPNLQVISMKVVTAKQERWRAVVSDGKDFMQAMFGSQHNEAIHSGKVKTNTVICVEEYMVNQVKNRRVLLILQFSVVSHHANILGEPANIEGKNAMAEDEPQVAAPQSTERAPQTNTAPVSSSNNTSSNYNRPNNFNRPNTSNNNNRAIDRSSMSNDKITPIAGLNSYTTNRGWTTRAKVTAKSEKKSFKNKSSGEPSAFFSVDLMDEDSEIRGTFFGSRVEELYETIQVKRTYYFSGGVVKAANPTFNTLKNQFEITFDDRSTIEDCDEEISGIPDFKISPSPIISLKEHMGKLTDVCGVIVRMFSPNTIQKAGNTLTKRSIVIADHSPATIELTLWGDHVPKLDKYKEGDLIAVKSAKVGNFRDCSLSTVQSSVILSSADAATLAFGKAAKQFVARIEDVFNDSSITAMTTSNTSAPTYNTQRQDGGEPAQSKGRKTIQEAKDGNFGQSNAETFTCYGTIIHIRKDNPAYPACDKCNKKLLSADINNISFYCNICGPKVPQYKYILATNVADHTGSSYVTAFGEQGQQIVHRTPDELMQDKYSVLYSGDNEYTKMDYQIDCALFQIMDFKIRCKFESNPQVQDSTPRQKMVVVYASPLDNPTKSGQSGYAAAAKTLLETLKSHQ